MNSSEGAPRPKPPEPSAINRAKDLLTFIDSSPTAYHAVEQSITRLEAAGFQALEERATWALKENQGYYVTRNGSTLVAFILGQDDPARAGFTMVGAHTDSPNLRLKPQPSYEKRGYMQLGVEVYGGVLLSTWLDRDLSIAGRVAIKNKDRLELRLVKIDRPMVRISNLAIHLNRTVNQEGLKLNAQDHMAPIWSLGSRPPSESATDALRHTLAEALEVQAEDILNHDLALYDLQKGSLSGLHEEFIHVARLDNLASCHSGLTALIETRATPLPTTRLLAFYDHEEVGSRSAQGAAGPFLKDVLHRCVEAHPKKSQEAYPRAIASSFMVSIDMAHAVHPNYADRHEPQHMPVIGQGPVVKTNAGQSYATDGESAARFIALCLEAGFRPQSFVTRTDLSCGSTIGPITAGRLGVKTVDVGNPMLSMHSIREMAGTQDVELMHRTLVQLFSRPNPAQS